MRDYKEPEWTAENINRKTGDTTFKICGWCTHAGGGSCRYSCHIETTCNLMKSYAEDVHWDTKCKIIQLGKDDIASIIKTKLHEIKESREHIKDVKKEIDVLNKIEGKAKKIPPLVDNRKSDHFNLNDVVWVFHDHKWNRGIVALGYIHHDGCVSYVLDNYPETKKQPCGCGIAVPCVMKDWEYKYFKKHPDDYVKWLELSDREYNGEVLPISEYYKALIGVEGGIEK